MSNTLKNMAAAVGLTFLTACSTTSVDKSSETSVPLKTTEQSLLGTMNPETGCFEKKEKHPDGSEKIVDIICPHHR